MSILPFEYPTEASNSSKVVGMSLKENGTNAHARGLAQQPNSLRKPMAKR